MAQRSAGLKEIASDTVTFGTDGIDGSFANESEQGFKDAKSTFDGQSSQVVGMDSHSDDAAIAGGRDITQIQRRDINSLNQLRDEDSLRWLN